MNIYLLLILFILVGEYILGLVTSRLDIKNMTAEVPGPFREYYDAEKYARSQNYARENARVGIIQSTLQILFVIPFLLLGGFNLVDGLVRGFGYGSIITGILYITAFLLLFMLLELPFGIYGTFVIEEKYGFNKTTVKTFILDLVKGLVLFTILGVPLLALILWFFEKTGTMAPLYLWGIIIAFQLFMNFLAPVVILPLFNKFEPLQEGELKEAIEKYAREQDFRLKGVFTMDGSRRSTRGNALFVGFGKFRRIILYDTLIEKHTTNELVATLAHEMGHFRLKHVVKLMVTSFLETGLMFFFLSLFIGNRAFFDAFRMEELSVYACLIFFGFLYSPVSILLSLISNKFSRRMEYEADRFAVATTGKKEDLIVGLKKLTVDSFGNLTPHPLKVILSYSHPPILKRIEAIDEIDLD